MDSNGKAMDSNDTLEWREEDYYLQKVPTNDFSQCLWDNVNVNEDNLIYLLDEQTPIKDCADLSYQVYDVVDNANKGMEDCIETSQMKRRRMLQFTSDSTETDIGHGHFTSLYLKSKVREDSLMEDGASENPEWDSHWNSSTRDDGSTFEIEGWDLASEGWLANCLDNSEMHCSLNEMDDCMVTDDQVDPSEIIKHETETDALRETPNPSPIKIIKGRTSFLRTPKKLVTPVAYPFALIKPCGVQGDVTLRDINQRIHAPPPSRSKNKMDDDPSSSFPTSAFSGKPVVLKTKIHTEGGKGSITIMRTKG
ncbi:uncharacterized protein A4U43_C10F5470 [Asparagus officinalis]|uniref:Protein XRI1 n=1 Tax=Asparagus officinalis TaxID=4686 RepID=A0A5P1E0X4_ASPOF|nr:protein XRI1 [Asparagus officinalis]ONK56231.1 uncharacterized protein A4U43_C10F5470 [Asparagus officinalis]